MKHLKSFNEDIEEDYSGTYEDLSDFIYSNNLEKKLSIMYDIPLADVDDSLRGELDTDEGAISTLCGNLYRVFYSAQKDEFSVTKKIKKSSIKFKITKSDSTKIIEVIEDAGIYTDYKPRFKITTDDGIIIGGSTYNVSDDIYEFDCGIIEDYQGNGLSKKLIVEMIKDATELNCIGIQAQVINEVFFEFLLSIGFDGEKSSDVYYAYKKI